jgi:hypothetical protein
MATDVDEPDTPLSVKKKRHKWAKLVVAVVVAVYRLVKLARAIDKTFPAIREWLTNL